MSRKPRAQTANHQTAAIDGHFANSLRAGLELLKHSPLAVFLLDNEGRPRWHNDEVDRLATNWSVPTSMLLPANHASIHHQALTTPDPPRDIYYAVGGYYLMWRIQPVTAEGATLWYGHDVTAQRLQRARLLADQARYRLLVENSRDLISRHAKDGTFLYASPASRTLLGYEPHELVGRSAYTQLFHPDDLKALFNKDPRVFYEAGYYQYEYRVRRKDGSYIWFETTSVTYRDPATNELADILCVSRDVTRRIDNEKIRDWLARTVDATTDYVLAFNPNLQLKYANRAARALFSLPKASPSTPLERFYTPRSVATFHERLLPQIETSGSWQGELEMLDPKGRTVPVLTVALPYERDEETLSHITLLNRDISERKAAEALVRQQQQRLDQAHRLSAAGELASQIAHELNQPLAATANYASGVLKLTESHPNLSAADLREPLEKLKRQVTRLGDVLKHVRQSIKRGHVRRGAVDLAEVMRNTREHCEWEANEAGVSLELNIAADLPAVSADRVPLEQVLVNLISNAVKACRNEAPENRRVEMSAWRSTDGSVRFALRDYGPGIPKGFERHIFEVFYTTHPGGLGMGLPISASIMEALGGSLTVTRADGQGACFVGTLQQANAAREETGSSV